MKTIVYVDGFNLYHGRLRHTPYKWLDLFALFEGILKKEDPGLHLIQVKYFTAKVKARYSQHGQTAMTSQEHYHRALEYLYPDKIEIITGYFTDEPATLIRHKGNKASDIDINNREKVWRIEEKQSDVRLAMEMYRDAINGNCELAVLCSSDSDLVPPMEMIKRDTSVRTAVVLPRVYTADPTKRRPPNRQLTEKVSPDWAREYIHVDELKLAIMSNRIGRKGKKPLDKPEYW